MEGYVAIFDIIESRKSDDRYKLQILVKNTLEYLNKLFKDYIKKEVVFGAGDEFQGLFSKPEIAYLYARKLELMLYPIKVRCGIGYGNVFYFNDKWESTELDGTAYHNARTALEEIPGKRSNYIYFNLNSEYDKYLNRFSILSASLRNHRSMISSLIDFLIETLSPLNTSYFETENYYSEILVMLLANKVEWINKHRKLSVRDRVGEFKVDTNAYKDALSMKYKSELEVNHFSVESSWERGLTNALSKITNTTQQNINNHISLANLKEIRSLDATIMIMLEDLCKK